MTINEGLWSNTITLLLIMVASLIAIIGGVPVGNWGLEQLQKDASFTWYFLFAGIWIVFFFTLAIMRVLTDKISRTRMRFLPVIDAIAGPLMGIFVAILFTSFAAFTLRLPIGSGVWEKKDITPTQGKVYRYARAPYANLFYGLTKAENSKWADNELGDL